MVFTALTYHFNTLLQDVKCVSGFKLAGFHQDAKLVEFCSLDRQSAGHFGAHSAGILSENQIDPGESMKHEDHVVYLLDVDEDKRPWLDA